VRWYGSARVTEGIKARLILAITSFVKLGRLAQGGDEIRASE